MNSFKTVLMLGIMALFAACAQEPTKFLTYDGPEVTSLVVFKERREMLVMHNNDVLQTMSFELGFAPEGPKQFERDGRTPEGTYRINRRNPNSQFHLSLGISYPNVNQVAAAAAVGRDAGGEIFIHGTPRRNEGDQDWTVGCIAVTNEEIEQLYAMVKDGTPIFILP
jgi:murein L,D-transpeptidase YafK